MTELIKITPKSPEQTLSVELSLEKEHGATTRQMQHIDAYIVKKSTASFPSVLSAHSSILFQFSQLNLSWGGGV